MSLSKANHVSESQIEVSVQSVYEYLGVQAFRTYCYYRFTLCLLDMPESTIYVVSIVHSTIIRRSSPLKVYMNNTCLVPGITGGYYAR